MKTADKPGEIWVVSGEEKERACLRAELIERGYRAVGFPSLAPALYLLTGRPSARPDTVVVDLTGVDPEGPEIAALVRSRVPLIGIVGALEAKPFNKQEEKFAVVLRRPVAIGEIVRALENVSPAGE